VILNLVSGPRNISTALMYAFAQRTDTTVFDEPFYAVYLAKSEAPHPGADEVLQALSQDESLVKTQITRSNEKPVVFVKNMAHHMEVLNGPWITNAVNIFLIRDPKQIIASYSAVIDHPVMRDIGIEYQYKLFSELRGNGVTPIVLDSQFLLEDPPTVLSKICVLCGLDFEQRMLHWPAGPKDYDGVWAKHWYSNVHKSTGFEKQPTSSRPLPEHLQPLYARARGFYRKLLPFSVKA
jgi:Sulfotransferase domain